MHPVPAQLRCPSKRRYASKRLATDAAGAYAAQFPASDGNMQAYLCVYCGHWHIGHRDQERREAAKKQKAPPPDEFRLAMQRLGVKEASYGKDK